MFNGKMLCMMNFFGLIFIIFTTKNFAMIMIIMNLMWLVVEVLGDDDTQKDRKVSK